MNQEENTVPQPGVPQPQSTIKIGKFKASRMIVKESWNILKQDTELVWFPILSLIVSLFALALLAFGFYFIVLGGDSNAFDSMNNDTAKSIIGYITLFIYYLVMFCIANYFIAGMFTIVNARFNGTDASFSDGIAGANKNISKIFMWSLVSATVGIILQIISDKFKFIGRILSGLFGAAWAILTYFSLPSLIIGGKNVKESFAESAQVIRKNWGETIIVNFGVGLFFGLIVFLLFLLSLGLLVLFSFSPVAMIIVGIFFVLCVMAIIIISTTLHAIFKLALYQYAITGNVPQGYTQELVTGAIKAGKK